MSNKELQPISLEDAATMFADKAMEYAGSTISMSYYQKNPNEFVLNAYLGAVLIMNLYSNKKNIGDRFTLFSSIAMSKLVEQRKATGESAEIIPVLFKSLKKQIYENKLLNVELSNVLAVLLNHITKARITYLLDCKHKSDTKTIANLLYESVGITDGFYDTFKIIDC